MNKKLIVAGMTVASFLVAGTTAHAAKAAKTTATTTTTVTATETKTDAKTDGKCGQGTCGADMKTKKEDEAKCNAKMKKDTKKVESKEVKATDDAKTK